MRSSHSEPSPLSPTRPSGGRTLCLVPSPPPPRSDSEAEERATKLGLYLGYDRARVSLGRLAGELGRTPMQAPPLQGRASRGDPHADEIERGARAAAFAAFALVCEQAEEQRRELCERWPELREDMGGPVPVRESDASLSLEEISNATPKNGGSGEPPSYGR